MEFVIEHIGDLCKRITDGSHFSPENNPEGRYPMYSVKDMEFNGFALSGYKTIGEDVFQKLSKSDCRPLMNDVLIAKDGSYLKYVFKVSHDLDACILSSIAILRPNLAVVDPDYFVYLLRTKSVKSAMANYVSGSALPRIILSDFKKMKVRIEKNLPTQRRIASILSAYDNLIENNNKRIRLLEQMAENLYKEWFVRFRFPGHEKVEMENGLPKGWKRTKLTNEYKTSSGGTPSRTNTEYYENGSIPWIKTGELQDCILTDTEEYITENAVKHSSAKLFKKGTLLMAMYGVNIGKLAISNIDATCNQACCVITPKRIESKYYLFYYLKSIRDYLLSISFGAAQQNLSQELIKALKIVMPDDATIISFEQRVGGFYNQIHNLQQQNILLSRQRDLLLPRLMSGKLEVKG